MLIRVLATAGLMTCIISITAGVVYIIDRWFDDVPRDDAE